MRDLLESLTGKGLSSTAKLIAVLEAAGVTDRAEIERLTECKTSTVRENVRALRSAGNPSAMENQRQISITCDGNPSPSDGNPSQRQKSSAGNPSNDVQRQKSIASPARGVVPNPTTVEVVDTKTLTTSTLSSSFKVSPLSVSPSPGAKVCKRGSRLPDDWKLPVDWQQWTRVNFPATSAEAVTLEADKFRDFWCSKAGQGATKLDWQATWRNWCRTAFAAKPGRQPLNGGRSAYDERIARQRAQIAEARALIAARGARDAAHH